MSRAIIGNIRGAVKLDFEWPIARNTAFVGPNGTGKTAVQEAIDLAVNHKRFERAALDPIFPPGYSHAEATLDVLGARYTFDSRLETQSGPAAIDPSTANGVSIPRPVIVRPASWLVALGPQRAREEVFARWGGDMAISLYPPATLSPTQKDLWQKGLDDVRTEIKAENEKRAKKGKDLIPSDPASLLSELQSWAKREKLACGRQRDALAETIGGLQTTLPSTAGAEDLSRLESALAAAETAERMTSILADQSSRVDQRVAKLNADIASWNDRLAKLQVSTLPDRAPIAAEVASVEAVVASHDSMHDVFAKALEAMTIDACPCCGAPSIDRAGAIQWHKNASQGGQAARIALADKRQQLAGVDHQIAAWNSERDAVVTEQARIQREAELIERDRAALPAPYNGPSSAELRPMVAAARAAAATRAAIEQQAKQLDEQNARWTIAQTVEKTAGIELKRYIEKISSTIDAAVRKYLAPVHRERFLFDFDTCRFEMIGGDGRPHERHEQSGGEYAALTLAVARAWAGDRPYIMLLEYGRDLAELDSFGALSQVLDTLASIDDPYCILVVVASPQPLPIDGDKWLVHQTTYRPRAVPVEQAMPVIPLSERVVPTSALSVVAAPTPFHPAMVAPGSPQAEAYSSGQPVTAGGAPNGGGHGFFNGDASNGHEADYETEEGQADDAPTVRAPSSRASLDSMTVATGPIGVAPPAAPTPKGKKKATKTKTPKLRAKPSARKSR